MNKKYSTSKLSNNLVLVSTAMVFVAAILFLFSKKFPLGVGAIWLSAGVLWLLRYGWQVRNPYIEITDEKMIINKSPILRKEIKVSELRAIIGKTEYSIKLELSNGKKIKISLMQVEKGKRDELHDTLKELVAEKNPEKP